MYRAYLSQVEDKVGPKFLRSSNQAFIDTIEDLRAGELSSFRSLMKSLQATPYYWFNSFKRYAVFTRPPLEELLPKKRLDIDLLQDKEDLAKRLDRLGVSPRRAGNKLPPITGKSAPLDGYYTPKTHPKDEHAQGSSRFSKNHLSGSRLVEEPSVPSFEEAVPGHNRRSAGAWRRTSGCTSCGWGTGP